MKLDWKPGTMIYPLPAVLISCGDTPENYNMFTVSWVGTVCTNPAMCYISVRPERHSYPIIKESGEFVINLTTSEMARATDWCGVRSGKEYDKAKETGLTYGASKEIKAPIIVESPLSIECRVKQIIPLGTHDMFLAEVVNVQADDSLLNPETGEWDLSKANPLVYVHGKYFDIGDFIGKFGWSVKKNSSEKKDNMRIKFILFILLLLFPVTIFSQEEKNDRLKFNYGIKLGFHAAAYNSTDFNIDGYKYDDRVIQSNKIGYSIAPFIRFTKNRFYLQTETNFSISRYYFEFQDETDLQSTIIPTYELTTYCMQVPLLFGYNFVQSGVYGMSFFTGLKTKFIFTPLSKQEFHNFKYHDLHESLHKTTYYWEVGLGINIANFFFDFVYDIGLSNNTHGIVRNSTNDNYRAKRSDNLLNFSVGIIF